MQEPYTVNMDMSRLSDDELSHKLRSLGVNPGPIVGSTRRLYERKLASLLLAGRPDGPAALLTHQVTDGGGSAVRRRLGGGGEGTSPGAAGGCDLDGLDPDSPALRPVFLRDETDQPSPRRAVSEIRDASGRIRDVRDVSGGRLNSRHVAACEADYEEELRPWVRQFIKLCIMLALAAAGYYVYHNGADWPAVRSLREAARAAVTPGPAAAPSRPLVAPPAAAANN